MTTTSSWTKALAADQHPWDREPHTVYDAVPVTELELWDVLAQTLQIEGMAVAEHRGKPAIRLDVNNVAAGGKGRLVLTVDQVVSDVKRYRDGGPAPSVASVLASRVSGQREATTTHFEQTYDWPGVALQWVATDGDPDAYENDEQRLFAYACAVVEAYSQLLMSLDKDGDTSDETLRRENISTLQSIAENIAPDCVVSSGTVSSGVIRERRAALHDQIQLLLSEAKRQDRPDFYALYRDRVDDLLTRSGRELRGR